MNWKKEISIFLVTSLLIISASAISEKIQSILNKANSKTSLDLRNCGITGPDVKGVIEYLKSTDHHGIKLLDLSENDLSNCSREVGELFKSLKATNISHLIMRKVQLQNQKLFDAIMDQLRRVQLTKLDFSNNSFDDSKTEKFFEEFRPSSIEELILDSCNVTDIAIFYAIDNIKLAWKVSKISLQDNFITNVGGPLLLKMFTASRPGVEYSLEGNDLGVESINTLINESNNRKRKSIVLRRNNIGLEGCMTIVQSLKNSNFTSLDLSYNNLNTFEVELIASVLKYSKIQSLTLDNNKINSKGVQKIRDQLLLRTEPNFLEIDSRVFFHFQPMQLKREVFNVLNTEELKITFDKEFVHELEETYFRFIDTLTDTKINHLDLEFGNIAENECGTIIITLPALTNVTTLRIYAVDNNIVKFQKLVDTLPQTKINSLALQINRMTIDDFKIFLNIIKNTSLHTLDLSGNAFNKYSLEFLMKGLREYNITTLKLRSIVHHLNPANLIQIISKYLQDTKITSLDLSSNSLGDNEIRNLAKFLPSTNITKLYLNDNQISDTGLVVFFTILIKSHVDTLHLDKNYITNGGLRFLAEGLNFTRIVDLTMEDQVRLPFDDVHSLERIDELLKENQIKYGQTIRQKKKKIAISLNKLSLKGAPKSKVNAIADILRELNITEFTMPELDINDNHVSNYLVKAIKLNKLILSLNVTGKNAKIDYYLDRNRKLFEKAESVINSYKLRNIKSCSKENLDAYLLFADTIDLWENRYDDFSIKDKIKKEIYQLMKLKEERVS